MSDTKIQWTQKVWNPIRGCRKVSAGCANCYAERMAARFCGPGQPYDGLVFADRDGRTPGWTGEARFFPEMLAAPLRWRKPSLVFVNSMSDLFHEDVTFERLDAIFGVMWACLYIGRDASDGHTFQILTKRAARMAEYFSTDRRENWATHAVHAGGGRDPDGLYDQTRYFNGPHPRIHLGVSVENQAAADERIPLLLQCPAAVRWVSCEPLLGSLDITEHLKAHREFHMCLSIDGALNQPRLLGGFTENGKPVSRGAARKELSRRQAAGEKYFPMCSCSDFDPQIGCPEKAVPGLDWIVCGGESGPNARPMHPDWASSLRDQCREAGVPFWFKQWGEFTSVYDRDLVDKEWRSSHEISESNQPGRWLNIEGGHGFHGDRVHFVKRVGKSKAGNLLDGVRHEMRPGEKWL